MYEHTYHHSLPLYELDARETDNLAQAHDPHATLLDHYYLYVDGDYVSENEYGTRCFAGYSFYNQRTDTLTIVTVSAASDPGSRDAVTQAQRILRKNALASLEELQLS